MHAREVERSDEPLTTLPPASGWVAPEAEDAWKLLGEAAIRAGTLCESDLPSLAMAASLWHLLGIVRSRIHEEPTAIRDAANLAGKLTQLLQQLGLTPRSRQLISAPAKADEDAESPFVLAARLRQAGK